MNGSSVRIDLRIIILLLLAIIAGMFFVWKPWQSTSQKTIKVTGEGTVTSAPDEFIFNLSYQKQAVTTEQAVAQVSELGNGVVVKLKSFGLDSSMIKTSVSSNQSYKPISSPVPTGDGFMASYQITATAKDKDTAKKISDYVATTPVLNTVTPQATFSKSASTKLKTEARTKALKDARTKAEQTASELGLRLGKVVSVSEPNQYGGPITLEDKDTRSAQIAPDQTPILETGTQDLSFSLTVEYQIK